MKKFHRGVCSLQSWEISSESVCDVVCAPPHYFNKPILPADCCYIKRMADDPCSVVKLVPLP